MDKRSYPSQDFRVISRGEEDRGLERRFLPRLSVASEQFRLKTTGKIFSVTDLSEQGMGFWIHDSADVAAFAVGGVLEGVLNLQREKFPILSKIRNMSADRVGCEFENLSPEAAQALKRLLDPALLGALLRPIPSGEVKNTLWYHGPSETDLMFRRSPDGQYSKLALYFRGTFIQWEEEGGVQTGQTRLSIDRSEVRGIFRQEVVLLTPDEVPDPQKLSVAKTIILSSNLPLDLKTWCVRKFER